MGVCVCVLPLPQCAFCCIGRKQNNETLCVLCTRLCVRLCAGLRSLVALKVGMNIAILQSKRVLESTQRSLTAQAMKGSSMHFAPALRYALTRKRLSRNSVRASVTLPVQDWAILDVLTEDYQLPLSDVLETLQLLSVGTLRVVQLDCSTERVKKTIALHIQFFDALTEECSKEALSVVIHSLLCTV